MLMRERYTAHARTKKGVSLVISRLISLDFFQISRDFYWVFKALFLISSQISDL